MRSHVLNGTGERRNYARGTALVNGQDRTVNGESDGVDLSAIASAVAVVSELFQDFFQQGGGYDPSNGGEVRRQLNAIQPTGSDLLRPYANPYMSWLKANRPEVWNNGKIWDQPDIAHRSRWKDHYETLLAAGLPPGSLLDANMVPVGLAQAVAATEAAQTTNVVTNATPVQVANLQLLAMQLAGLGTPAEQAAARNTYRTLDAPSRLFVDGLVALWTQANATTPPDPATQPDPPPQPAAGSGAALVGAGLLLALLS